MKWVETQLEREKITAPTDFGNGWSDGLALVHLINAICPNSIDLTTISTPESAIDAVIHWAFQHGVPILLTKEDILAGADSKAMTTWVSYFKQAFEENFPRAKAQKAQFELLRNWINWFLPDSQINDFQELLTIPPPAFKSLLAKALHCEVTDIRGETTKDMIAESITDHGVKIQDCSVDDILNGNLFALNHYVARLMKHCYRSQDNEDILARVNRYAATPVVDVPKEWQSGDLLIKLASSLAPEQSVDDEHGALNILETTLQLPQILDLNMTEDLSISTVSSYIKMVDYHWNLYLQNKLEQNLDEKYANAWIQWAEHELGIKIGNISSLMSMENLFPLVQRCLPDGAELEGNYNDEDQREEFLKHIIEEHGIALEGHQIQELVNYEWTACDVLLQSLFAMRYGTRSKQEMIQFFHNQITLYPIYDLKNAWKSQKILIGLHHALFPDAIETKAVTVMAAINRMLDIPNLFPNTNIIQITPRLRNQYLSLIVSKMISQDIKVKVIRNIDGMIDFAQWAVANEGVHIKEGASFQSKNQIRSELLKLIQSHRANDGLTIEEEQVLFKHFECQTKCHCSNINDICQWITGFIKDEVKEDLKLEGIVALRSAWNQGLILQHLSSAINPIVMDDPDEMPSMASYYKAILWAVDIPDVIQFTNCDDLSHNSEPNVLAFLSLIRQQLKEQEFHSTHLVPWLNSVGATFLESQITTDLQVFKDVEMFRDLCVECLRCDIESESFPEILAEIFEDRKLMELEGPDMIHQILNGNIGARKAFLYQLFAKYNDSEKADLDLKFKSFLEEHISPWNWTEIEEKCQGNYEIINELKAEKFLQQIHRIVTPPQLMMVPDDVNAMVALQHIASTLNIAHNLTPKDINISNLGFKLFATQIQQKLGHIGNGWLLNWINDILSTESIPQILDLEEIVSNKLVLSTLERIVFSMPPSSVETEELQLTVQSIIDGPNDIVVPFKGSEVAWKLFKHHHGITISEEELQMEYDHFVAAHHGISWKNGDIIRLVACEALNRSQRRSQVTFDVMDHNVPISLALEALDIPMILESDQLHLYSDRCQQMICHLASVLLLDVDQNRFVIHWINWLLRSDGSTGSEAGNQVNEVNEMRDILSINVLNDLLTLKHMISGLQYRPQSTLQEILNELHDTKTFDFTTFEPDTLSQRDPSNIGNFGWSLFKYFYDIPVDIDYHIAILTDYFQIDGITDLLGKDFQNESSFVMYARSQQEDSEEEQESSLQYLIDTMNVPELFDLENINGDLKRVPFRARIAFFTILRVVAIQKTERDEQEQKSAEYQTANGGDVGFQIGQFIRYSPENGDSYVPAVIVGYNGHSQLFDLKAISVRKGHEGGQTVRFVSASQLKSHDESRPIRVGDDDVYVDIEGGDEPYNLQCIVESVTDEGLVMVEILDSKEANVAGKKGKRMKVPFEALSRIHKPYYLTNEQTKENLKEYLRKMLKSEDDEDARMAAFEQYERDNFISPAMRNAALNEVMAEVREKQRLDVNGKYVDQLDALMNKVRALMSGPKNVEVSFTVTTGRQKGGDKSQIDIIITGPILAGKANSHIDSYRLGLENIKDQGDGKYKVTFIGSGVGLYNIRVVMFGKESPLSPFQFMMKPTGGEWLRSDDRGKITAVKSDTMTAKSTDKVSQGKRKRRMEKAMNFSEKQNKKDVKELMKLPESKKSILDEIEAIMTKFVDFEKKKKQIDESQKTEQMKEIEGKLEQEHDKVILSAFKRHINYPGLILTKYPNSRFAKPHTRRVKIGQLDDDMVNAVFMWTETKMCHVRDVKDIKAGISDLKPWKYCKVEPERCFEMNANGKILCFHAATQYERDFIVKGFQLMLDAIFQVL